MWLLWTSLALAGTLDVKSDESVEFVVDGTAVTAEGKSTEVAEVFAGAHALQVSRAGVIVWAGELHLPSDDVSPTLKWKKGKLTLDGVKVKKTTAEKMMKVGNIASGVAAGAQQASAISDDLGAARSDFDKAQRGELTESSHTSVSMEVGPGGVSSSSSRTTAGASGVQHSNTSSHISGQGSSLSQTNGSLTSSGYQQRSTDKSLRMVAGDRGEVWLYGGPVQPGETLAVAPVAVAPVAVAPVAAAPVGGTPSSAVAAPPVAAPPAGPSAAVPSSKLPKQIYYANPAASRQGDLEVNYYNPFSSMDEAKVAVRIHNDGLQPLTFTMDGGSFGIAGLSRSPSGRRAGLLMVVPPGESKKKTFGVDGDLGTDAGYRVDPLEFTLSGLTSYAVGNASGAANSTLATDAFTEGGVSCSLGKFKEKKGTLTAMWKCEATDTPVFVDVASLSVTDGSGSVQADSALPVLLVAGSTERIEVSWGLDGTVAKAAPDSLEVTWSAAVKQATPTELAPVTTSFTPAE